MMSGQKYTRTNFEEDEMSGAGTPPPAEFNSTVVYKQGATMFRGRRTLLEFILLCVVVVATLVVIILAALLASRNNEITHLTSEIASQSDSNKHTVLPVKPIVTQKPKTPSKTQTEYCLTPACITASSMLIDSLDTSVDPCQDFYQYTCGKWINNHIIPSGHARWSIFSELRQSNQEVMKRVIEQPINSSQSDAEIKAKLYYQSCMDKNKTIDKLRSEPLEDLITQLGGWPISNRTGVWSEDDWVFQSALESMKVYGTFFSYFVGEDDKNSSQNILQVDQGGLGLPDRDFYLNKTVGEDKVVLTAYLDYMTLVGVLLGGEKNQTRDYMEEVIEFEIRLANITVPNEERRNEEEMYHKMSLAEVQTLSPFIDWTQLINKLLAVGNVTVTSSEQIKVFMPDYLHDLSVLVLDTLQQENGKRITRTLGTSLQRLSQAEDMIEEVKMAFKNNLPSLEWMDDETRAAAIDKANAVIDLIGFPEYILNKTRLNKEYKELEINASEYFQNNIRNFKFELRRNAALLREAPEPYVWDMTPPTVNAYYTPTKNEIVFPAGILQAPFYNQDWPKSLNFGAMGVVMGHELTHGFDDQERTKCMIDQYSAYKLNDENIRGKQTLGENIADNGGLKAAYHVWCSKSTKEADHLGILSDPHSPGEFRVIGTLSNSYEFAKAYKCPKNSPMNPDKKCVVW
ncbi:NEP3-like protein [Mya arenaria]|uniref:NEP3-like protein n=1 Tax=Mya arenaria TaxID=6604 RepID=A0ABY7F1U9_MYAAR|nr:NEP3-like protein [Mya arenaria]